MALRKGKGPSQPLPHGLPKPGPLQCLAASLWRLTFLQPHLGLGICHFLGSHWLVSLLGWSAWVKAVSPAPREHPLTVQTPEYICKAQLPLAEQALLSLTIHSPIYTYQRPPVTPPRSQKVKASLSFLSLPHFLTSSSLQSSNHPHSSHSGSRK